MFDQVLISEVARLRSELSEPVPPRAAAPPAAKPAETPERPADSDRLRRLQEDLDEERRDNKRARDTIRELEAALTTCRAE